MAHRPVRLPFVILAVLVTACSNDGGTGVDTGTDTGGTGPTCASTFTNPLGPGADPWVVRSGNLWYSVESRDNGIWVYRSDTLTKIKKNAVRVWQPSPSGWNQVDIWAPELHRIDDKWFLYYSATASGFTDSAPR